MKTRAATRVGYEECQTRVSEVFPERCSLEAKTEGGRWFRQERHVLDTGGQRVWGLEMTSLGHRDIWKAMEMERMEARVAE